VSGDIYLIFFDQNALRQELLQLASSNLRHLKDGSVFEINLKITNIVPQATLVPERKTQLATSVRARMDVSWEFWYPLSQTMYIQKISSPRYFQKVYLKIIRIRIDCLYGWSVYTKDGREAFYTIAFVYGRCGHFGTSGDSIWIHRRSN